MYDSGLLPTLSLLCTVIRSRQYPNKDNVVILTRLKEIKAKHTVFMLSATMPFFQKILRISSQPLPVRNVYMWVFLPLAQMVFILCAGQSFYMPVVLTIATSADLHMRHLCYVVCTRQRPYVIYKLLILGHLLCGYILHCNQPNPDP